MDDFWSALLHNEYFMEASIAVTVLVFIALFFGLPVVVRRLPADFFTNPVYLAPRKRPPERGFFRHCLGVLWRNAAGVLLVLLGTVFLQGVLVVVAGLALMDFRGKRELVRRLVRIGFVWRILGGIRRRGGCEPLVKP